MDTLPPEHLNTPSARLKWARERKFPSAAQAADALGIPHSTYRALEAGTRQGEQFKPALARKLSRRLNVPEDWLQCRAQWPAGNQFDAILQYDSRSVPLLNYIAAGRMTGAANPYEVGGGEEEVTVHNAEGLGPHAFALRVRGDSMIPNPPGSYPQTFRDGDIVIVDPNAAPTPGCLVVAKTADHEESTFKKYRPRGEDGNGVEIIELVPLNEDYPTERIDAKRPGFIVGRVVEHHAKGL